MYCKYCGKKLEDGVLFCSECGKPVQGNSGEKEQKKLEKKRIHKKKRTSKRTTGVIAAALVLVVAAAGFGYKVYIGQDASELGTGQLKATREDDTENTKTVPEYVTESGKINEAEDMDFETDPETGLTKIKGGHTGKKVGYVNEKGEEVIPPIYDKVSEPGKNGLIRAEYYVDGIESDVHNYISKDNVVTRFFNVKGENVYDYVRSFEKDNVEHRSTVVREGNEYFLVDRQGNRICEDSYDYIEDADGYDNFVVKQGTKQGLVNSEGRVILEPEEVKIAAISDWEDKECGVYAVTGDEGSRVVTEKGKILTDWQQGQIGAVSLIQERYQINLPGGTTEVRDFEGKVVASGNYRDLYLDSNGFIRVFEDDTSVVLDCNGNEIISGEDEKGHLDSVYSFWDEEIGGGVHYTRENNEEQEREGFFTLDGKISLPCVYEKIEYVSDKQILIYAKDNQIGIMNLKNEILWEEAYGYFYTTEKEDSEETDNLLIVYKNGQYGLVDMLKGTEVLECEYDDITKDSRKKESWILKNDGKYGFWNQDDGTYIEIPYGEIYSIEDNYGEFLGVAVDADNDGYGERSGIIDRNGNCIVEPVYTQVYYDERNEVFFVRKDTETEDDYITETAVVDKNGQYLTPLAEYQKILWDTNIILTREIVGNPICVDYEGNSVFTIDGMVHDYLEEGYIGLAQNSGDVVATTDGQVIAELDSRDLDDDISDGLIGVSDSETYMNGYINPDGEEIIPCIYSDMDKFTHGLAKVYNDLDTQQAKVGLVNVKGDMLIDYQYDSIDVLDEDPNLIRVRKDDVDFYGIIDCRNRTIADLSYREDENGQYISIDDCFVGDNGTIDVYWSNGEEDIFDYSGNKVVSYSADE